MCGFCSIHFGPNFYVEVIIDQVYEPLLIHGIVIFVRKWRVRENGSTNMPTQLYEDPDKLTSRGQGNFELTHCPAYESTTTKPEPPPRTQAEVDQSSHYEL